MNSLFLLICSCACLCQLPVDSYKILGVFPIPSRSHYAAMNVVMLKLAEKGHKISIYSPYPQHKTVANFRDFDLSDCFLSKRSYDLAIDSTKNLMDSPIKCLLFLTKVANVSVESITECKPFQHLLQSEETFDLLITETFSYDVTLLFAHKFRVPFIGFVSHGMFPWHADRMGNPSNPSYAPTAVSGYLVPMDFWQRMYNLAVYSTGSVMHHHVTLKQNDETVKAILGPDSPSLYDIVRQTSILFTYTHSTLNPVAPLVPGVVEIGGAHIQPAKSLPSVCLTGKLF